MFFADYTYLVIPITYVSSILHPEYLFFSFQAIKSIRNKSTSFEQNKGADHCYYTESAPFHISLFLFSATWKSPKIIR